MRFSSKRLQQKEEFIHKTERKGEKEVRRRGKWGGRKRESKRETVLLLRGGRGSILNTGGLCKGRHI